MSRVLYLSYDGMTDPLGGSQVLPYLVGLAARGHQIDLISFEKPERSAEERHAVSQICAKAGIGWHPLTYHKRPPVLSTVYDVRRMQRLASRLHHQRQFQIVHCRSYISALVGLRMKRRSGVRFLFDMRGFWADERVEGGQWDLAKPIYKAAYNFFKRREADFLKEADHVVSLTEAGKEIMLGWRGAHAAGPLISVIPCCVDFDAFPPIIPEARAAARKELGIGEMTTVAAYLGSFGGWYNVGEMMDFFRVQLQREPTAVLLVISRDPPAEILAAALAHDIPADRLIIRPASRQEVPRLVAAADYGLFFIKPVFSKKASCPTKMGEFLALELPVITNAGVGDVDEVIADTGGGVVVGQFDEEGYARALDDLQGLNPDMKHWRSATRRLLDLANGVGQYDAIYDRIAGNMG